MQTGLKEAKLLDDDTEGDTKSEEIKQNPLAVLPNSESQEKHSQERLSEALKNIPSNDFNLSDEEIKEIKKKFKTYDDIKKELKDADMAIKTDGEIIGYTSAFAHTL